MRCKHRIVMADAQSQRQTGWLIRAVPELATAAARHGELEQVIAECLVRAREAWPQLAVDDEPFVRALATSVADATDAVAAIREIVIEDLYLAQACATGAAAALAAFEGACHGPVVGALRRMGLAADAIEEIIQHVRAKLFVATDAPPKIAMYSGRAPLASWVRTIATRAAVDRLRANEPATADDDALVQLPDTSDTPELAHFREQYRAEFKDAFEEALATLDVRERNVLRHHFVDGLTTEEIGALYGVHKTTAFRWLESARVALSKRTRSNFCQRVKVVPTELDSILRLVQSQIDLSLSRVLAS
jgi:RNA polymerase sigma-70 factor (ECF subfamily)